MSPLRVLVVDDEAPARSRMKRLLGEHQDVECLGEAESGLGALELVDALSPDVVFLDVEMPELDGIATAAALSDSVAVVFVTAFDEYALQAFDVSAVDYLVKPVDRARLRATLDRLRKRLPSARESVASLPARAMAAKPKMALRAGSKYVVFELANVSAIVARDSYSAFLVDGQEHLSDDSLERLEQRLDPTFFIRIHRSAIVNIAHVVTLKHEGDRKYNAELRDGTVIPISRAKLDEVKKRFSL